MHYTCNMEGAVCMHDRVAISVLVHTCMECVRIYMDVSSALQGTCTTHNGCKGGRNYSGDVKKHFLRDVRTVGAFLTSISQFG